MATRLECLHQLLSDLVMHDLAAVRDDVATVSEHIQRLSRDEDGYEVRKESCNFGRSELTAVGLIPGHAMYRNVR